MPVSHSPCFLTLMAAIVNYRHVVKQLTRDLMPAALVSETVNALALDRMHAGCGHGSLYSKSSVLPCE